jgi:hypothetical protein
MSAPAIGPWGLTSIGAAMTTGLRGLGLMALVVAPLGAQTQPAPAPAAATVMDVSVVDASGDPVPALTADRFRVQVGGRTRQIQSAAFVTADPAAGRSIVLVVDQNSLVPGAEGALLEVGRALVARLASVDRVALLAFPAPGPHTDLSTDRRGLIEALGQIKGRRTADAAASRIGLGEALAIRDGDPLAVATVGQRECAGIGDVVAAGNGLSNGVLDNAGAECFRRVIRTVDRIVRDGRAAAEPVVVGVTEAITLLDDAPGARAVVLLTHGLATGRRDPALGDIAARARSGHVSVNAVLLDPALLKTRGAPVNRQTERRSLLQRLDELTLAARGRADIVTPETVDGLERLLRATAGYYTLTVSDDGRESASARDDKRQDNIVRVDVPGSKVTVRAPPFLSTPATLEGSAPMSREDRLAEALGAGGFRTSTLPVRGAAALRLQANGATSLVISGEVDVLDTAGAPTTTAAALAADDVSMSYALFDQSQQPVAAGALPSGGAASPGAPRSFVGSLGGWKPGRYTLRLAAIDGAGRAGSVERAVDVRVAEAGGLTAGDVLFARVAPGQAEASPSTDEIIGDASIILQIDVAGEASRRRGLGGQFVVRSREGGAALVTRPAEIVPDDGSGLTHLVAKLEPGLLTSGQYEVVAQLKVLDGAALTSTARGLTLVPAAPSSAGAITRPIWLSSLTPTFARARVLEADVLKPAIARLEARATAPAVRRALAQAREGRPDALVVDAAVRREDPVAGAFLTGVSLFARGDLEAAALQFREALRSDAEFTPAMFYLGACYAAGGRDREAAGAWQTAMIDEAAGVVPALLADAWLRAGDPDAALDIVDEALAQAPTDAALVERRITALLALVRTADALTALDAAPPMSPDLLFAAMRVLVDAHTARQPVVSPDADRRRLQTYAERYKAVNGPQQALVESWIAAWR